MTFLISVLFFFTAIFCVLPVFYFLARLSDLRPQHNTLIKVCVVFCGLSWAALTLFFGDARSWAIIEIVAIAVLICLIDLRLLVIPDCLTISLSIAGLRLNLAGSEASIWSMLAGAIFGALLIGLPFAYYKHVIKRPGLGVGDVKLLAAIGLIVGPYQVPLVMAVGAAATLVVALVGRCFTATSPALRTNKIAFAPGLLAAMLASLVLGAA